MKQIEIQFKTFHLKGDDRTFFCTQAKVDYSLNVLGISYIPIHKNRLPYNWQDEKVWKQLPAARLKDIVPIAQHTAALGGVYEPAAELTNAYRMNILTPDSMDESTANALNQLKKAVGNVAEFVAERLEYSLKELSECLALEQIDAVALAIYNAEARHQGLIVGDQTGIGKGRVAAAFIRYGVVHGFKPIFFTEKPGLFSDIYRDLCAIHCAKYKPLIINATGGEIMDNDGNDIYKYKKATLEKAMTEEAVPEDCDFVCCTYSQLSTNDSEKVNSKWKFINTIATDNIVVLDEAHNAGGEVTVTKDKQGNLKITGNIGQYFQTKVLNVCRSVMYLSATYAKQPKNMPIYALNTCISELGDNDEFTKERIALKDPVSASEQMSKLQYYFSTLPLQEIISSSMAKFGQFIRRERKTEGMKVSYITLDEDGQRAYNVPNLKDEHFATYSNITKIIEMMRNYQEVYFTPYLKAKAREYASQGTRTKAAPSVSSANIFSSLFHLTNNILLSLKSEAIADRAIQYLQEGKSVIIALADTNESVLKNSTEAGKSVEKEDDEEEPTISVTVGQNISSDFTLAFDNIFKNLFRYYVRQGKRYDRHDIDINELEKVKSGAIEEYNKILKFFQTSTTGLCFSPIDVIRHRIEKSGYSVAECTGRKLRLEFEYNNYHTAKVSKVPKYSSKQGKHVSLCYKHFNNNEVDVMIINQSGSTGKSAHATNTDTKLKPEEVKQRVMLIGQAELDVNTEVQKRGRINRTGQFTHIPPLYEYIYSAVPCEKRFMMMLKAKLKSLDANTTGNQSQSNDTVLKTDDFFNKYGDFIVREYLTKEEQDANSVGQISINHVLNDPIASEPNPIDPKKSKIAASPMARTAFGRMQVLAPEIQEKIYDDILKQYNSYIAELDAMDMNDLEIKNADLRAKKISENILVQRTNDGTHSELVSSTFLTKYSVKMRKFKSLKEIEQMAKLSVSLSKEPDWNNADIDNSFHCSNDVILKRLANDYKTTATEAKEKNKKEKEEKIEILTKKVEQYLQLVEDYIEAGLSEERVEAQREKVNEVRNQLQELKKGVDPEFETKLNKWKSQYDGLRAVVDKLQIGNFFEWQDNIYFVYGLSIKLTSSKNIFTAPSCISVDLATTDPMNQTVTLNCADIGLAKLKEMTANKSTAKAYETLRNDDQRREEVMIVTGNITKQASQGNVITRFSLEDGSWVNGIIVRPQLVNGMFQYPEWCRYATVPINDKTLSVAAKVVTKTGRHNYESSYGGEFYIDSQRQGEYMEYRLYASVHYKYFFTDNNVRKCFTNPNPPFSEGLFRTTISDLNGLFKQMANNKSFTTRIPFDNIDYFAEALDLSKYKTQPWKKLSYNRNNIPADSSYKGAKEKNISELLIAELALLSFKRKQ